MKVSSLLGIACLCLTVQSHAQLNKYDFAEAKIAYSGKKGFDSAIWEAPNFDVEPRSSFYSKEIELQKAIETIMMSGNYTCSSFSILLRRYLGSRHLGGQINGNQTMVTVELPVNAIQQYGQGSSKSRNSSEKNTSSPSKVTKPPPKRKSSTVMTNGKEYTIVATENERTENNLRIVSAAVEAVYSDQGAIIGRGITSKVYRVVIESQTYAVKKSKAGFKKSLETEAEQALDFDHPNIIKLYGYASSSDVTLLVMDYFPTNLWSEIFPGKVPVTSSIEQSFNWVKQIIAAINYLHSLDWVHDDLKIENILLRKDGTLVVADLGFMGKVRCKRTRSERLVTVAYVDPYEENQSELMTFASDIWGLGILTSLLLDPKVMSRTLYPEFIRARRPHPSEIWEKTLIFAESAGVISEFATTFGLDLKGIKNNADLPENIQWAGLSKVAVLHAIMNFSLRQVPDSRPSVKSLFDIITTYSNAHDST